VDDKPNKDREQSHEVEQVIAEETIRGTKGKVYKGEKERVEDVLEEAIRTENLPLILKLLRAEGYSAQKIAAFEAVWREQRGARRRGGPSQGR
jgi:hypothetical protein